MDLNKKANSFITHVDVLKNDSILKLDYEARKSIYKNIRKEEEQKKKDDLEREIERRK